MDFPIFKTKIKGLDKKFDLISPEGQKEYFMAKAGKEIGELREFLQEHTFIAYLLGKKSSGKGTYSKMFARLINPERVAHFSIGDMIRNVDQEMADDKKREELFQFLRENYRGRISIEDIIESLEKRSTKVLLPTELILTLAKREIEKMEKKTLFIDGFPRNLGQVDFSLFFRDLIGYRTDPDVFVLIDVPENVINERIQWRRICPVCNTSRNLKLLPTSKVGYDKEKEEFYLICDNPQCEGARMVLKEGDELGIEPIKERLKTDEQLIKEALGLHGIPKVLLRNSVPVEKAEKYVDDYEITPEYYYERDEETGEIKIKEKPWVVEDDDGIPSYSLMPPPVVVALIKQLTEIFAL